MKNKLPEHILTCLSSSPSNGRVIIAAGKMSQVYHAELTALYVETPIHYKMDDENKEQLNKNIELAKKSGASIITTYGDDIAFQIAQYVKTAGITKIVIGRPNHKKHWLLHKPDIVQRLIQLVPDLEVFMIPDNAPSYSPKNQNEVKKSFSIKSFLITVSLLIISTLLGLLLKNLGFTDANIITLYILAVLFTAFLTDGQFYGIIFSVASVLIFNFMFTDPRFTFQAYDTGYPLTFLIMFIASMLTSSFTAKAKTQSKASSQKAYRTEVLLSASRNLQQAESFDEILNETANQLRKLLEKPILIISVYKGKLQAPLLFGYEEEEKENLMDYSSFFKEEEIIQWVLKNRAQAGAGTDNFSTAKYFYLPILGRDKVYAVVGISLEKDKHIGEFEKSLLMAILGECGVSLEKYCLHEAESSFKLAVEQEKLRTDLLRSISHDLRTPLTSISGNADMLMSDKIIFDEEQKQELYSDIYDDSVWLINLVENLLSITRMDDAKLNLNIKPEIISDVIEEALSHIGRRRKKHNIDVCLADELLIARMDASLIVQVLVNLLDNAIKYTLEGSNITISAWKEDKRVYMSVADNGEGILAQDKEKIFEMFYSGDNLRSDSRRGLGLGLALCKAIIMAHGGEIKVSNNRPRGTIFTFFLIGEEAHLDE